MTRINPTLVFYSVNGYSNNMIDYKSCLQPSETGKNGRLERLFTISFPEKTSHHICWRNAEKSHCASWRSCFVSIRTTSRHTVRSSFRRSGMSAIINNCIWIECAYSFVTINLNVLSPLRRTDSLTLYKFAWFPFPWTTLTIRPFTFALTSLLTSNEDMVIMYS